MNIVSDNINSSSDFIEHLRTLSGEDFMKIAENLTSAPGLGFTNETELHRIEQIISVISNSSHFFESNSNLKDIPLESNDTISQYWSETFLNQCMVFVDGYSVVFLALCGTFLNILGIVLTLINKGRRYIVFNILVLLLLVFDTIYILSEAIISSETHLLTYPKGYVWYYVYVVYPMRRFSMAASIFMTIALAHQRFCGVTRPILLRNVSSSSRRGLRRILQYAFLVIAFALIVNAPMFWEVEIRHNDSDQSTPSVEASALRENSIFSLVYVNGFRLLFLGIFPFASLVFLNYKIATATNHAILPTYDPHGVVRRRMDSERRMTKILISIVISFLVCHVPRVSLNCIEYYIIKEFDIIPIYIMAAHIISKLLLIANSMFNALFYLFCC